MYFHVNEDERVYLVEQQISLEPEECQQINFTVRPVSVGEDIKLIAPRVTY